MNFQNFRVWDKSRGAIGNLIVVFAAVWVVSLIPIFDKFLDSYFAFHPLPKGIVKPWGFVTYMFLHSGFFHMLSNALWLYFIGIILQDLVGDKVLLKLFFWGGLWGSIFYQLFYTFVVSPEYQLAYGGLVGASGGVSAVVVGTALFSPRYRVFLFGIFEVELRWIAVVKVILDITGAMGDVNRGGFICHLGGIFYALIYVYGYLKGNMPGWMDEMFLSLENIFGKGNRQPKRSRPASKSSSNKQFSFGVSRNSKDPYSLQTSQRSTKSAGSKSNGNSSFENEDEINRILDKIAQVGYQNLTDEERDILFRASKE